MTTPKDVTDLLQFINDSPSPYHAVQTAGFALKKNLKAATLSESETWSLKYGKTYVVTRDDGSLIAFTLPAKEMGKNLSFRIIGAHTDSPTLQLKPKPAKRLENYIRWGVAVYGGALHNSWLDRDLLIAGRVSVADGPSVKSTLVSLDKVKFRIPQLAIHLDREVNEKGLILNAEKHLLPILGLESGKGGRTADAILRNLLEQHGLKIPQKKSFSFDLVLADATPPSLGGLQNEFIYAPRIDNLAMSHAAVTALLRAPQPTHHINVIALFNHEEIGSRSSSGALSRFLVHTLERITIAMKVERADYLASLASSFFISADMAHALHPNYQERHDGVHMPLIGKGPVIKDNAKLRYATNSSANAFFQNLCQTAKVPVQNFVNRSDLGCGSTIGPLLASQLGMPVVDVGNPMLSMHSAREMAGTLDHPMIIKVFNQFFKAR